MFNLAKKSGGLPGCSSGCVAFIFSFARFHFLCTMLVMVIRILFCVIFLSYFLLMVRRRRCANTRFNLVFDTLQYRVADPSLSTALDGESDDDKSRHSGVVAKVGAI